MIDSASPELCKTLYELSGWEPSPGVAKGDNHWPAYNLGYLLRRLRTAHEKPTLHLASTQYWEWTAQFRYDRGMVSCDAEIPEDATCKLAIEMFKQGFLKADNQSED